MRDLLIALSDPLRLQVVRILWDGDEQCVCALMAHTGASQSRMSRHMQTLKKAGIVLDRRDAQWVRYRRNTDLPAELETIVDAVLAADRPTQIEALRKKSHDNANRTRRAAATAS